MIDANTIREVLNRKMKKDRDYSVQQIYALFPKGCLDAEDLLPSADPPKGDDLKWMRNVRNILQNAQRRGHVVKLPRGIYKRIRIII